MNTKPLLSILTIALIAAGCSSVSTPPQSLIDARDTVNSAAANPNVLANAPLELRKANDALVRADQALAKGENVEVDHNAYIATQRARTAVAAGNAKSDEDLIKTAEAERERARADARELEAQRARASAASARADARDARTEAAIQRAQADVSAQQAMNAQQQATQAQRDAAMAAEQAANAQAQAAASNAQAATLAQQLAAIEALQTNRGLVITLGDVLFEFNRAEVKPTAQARLGQLADFLKRYPDRRVSIEGHTDNVGGATYNLELSQRRAEAIKMQLVALGIAADRMTTVGYGKDFPVAANDTDTNRAINRRVEVVILEGGKVVGAKR
ncbi:MAG: DUF4398 and OmpA-like domain-containing protein [Betaproteobacteria bacterium]|nr:DUF4398 and OmpA-like domain-containing protein [Betaproteobacteria bacterium]